MYSPASQKLAVGSTVNEKDTPDTDSSIIPKDTLKLIEEAEKNKS